MIQFEPCALSIDEKSLMNALRTHYINAMQKAENKLIEIMRKEIMETTYGDAPGKPEWRKEISAMLQNVYSEVTDNYIKFGVGVPDDVAFNTFVKAMIIAYGGGFTAYGNATGGYSSGPITAGPTGRMVWDSDMAGKKPSAAETIYEIPQFNQEGNHFLYNSMILMKKHFEDVLAEASASIPYSLFARNVVVTKGRKGA